MGLFPPELLVHCAEIEFQPGDPPPRLHRIGGDQPAIRGFGVADAERQELQPIVGISPFDDAEAFLRTRLEADAGVAHQKPVDMAGAGGHELLGHVTGHDLHIEALQMRGLFQALSVGHHHRGDQRETGTASGQQAIDRGALAHPPLLFLQGAQHPLHHLVKVLGESLDVVGDKGIQGQVHAIGAQWNRRGLLAETVEQDQLVGHITDGEQVLLAVIDPPLQLAPTAIQPDFGAAQIGGQVAVGTAPGPLQWIHQGLGQTPPVDLGQFVSGANGLPGQPHRKLGRIEAVTLQPDLAGWPGVGEQPGGDRVATEVAGTLAGQLGDGDVAGSTNGDGHQGQVGTPATDVIGQQVMGADGGVTIGCIADGVVLPGPDAGIRARYRQHGTRPGLGQGIDQPAMDRILPRRQAGAAIGPDQLARGARIEAGRLGHTHRAEGGGDDRVPLQTLAHPTQIVFRDLVPTAVGIVGKQGRAGIVESQFEIVVIADALETWTRFRQAGAGLVADLVGDVIGRLIADLLQVVGDGGRDVAFAAIDIDVPEAVVEPVVAGGGRGGTKIDRDDAVEGPQRSDRQLELGLGGG